MTNAHLNIRVRAATSKGLSALRAHDYVEAIHHFEDALALAPNNVEVARLLKEARDRQNGIVYPTARLVKRRIQAHIVKARSAMEIGSLHDIEDAVRYLELVLDDDPDHQEAINLLVKARRRKQMLIHLQQGWAAMREGDGGLPDAYFEAIQHFENVLNIDPTDQEARSRLTEARVRRRLRLINKPFGGTSVEAVYTWSFSILSATFVILFLILISRALKKYIPNFVTGSELVGLVDALIGVVVLITALLGTVKGAERIQGVVTLWHIIIIFVVDLWIITLLFTLFR